MTPKQIRAIARKQKKTTSANNGVDVSTTPSVSNESQQKPIPNTSASNHSFLIGIDNKPVVIRDAEDSRSAILSVPTVSANLANGSTVPTSKLDGVELTDLGLRSVYVHAEALLQQISIGGLTLGILTQFQKDILYCYFSNFNPVVKRILSLFTQIVVSPISIQKPKLTTNDIVQDYIKAFFDKMVDKVELNSVMNDIVYNRFTYGRAYLLVESNYTSESDTDFAFDEDVLLNKMEKVTDKIRKDMEEIIKQYNDNPLSTTSVQRTTVLKNTILSINEKYKGAYRLRVVSPFEIETIEYNSDLGIKFYNIKKSVHLQNAFSNTYSADNKSDQDKIQNFMDIGYSRGLLEKHMLSTSGTYQVSNDPYDTDGCFMIELSNNGGMIGLDSILNDLIIYNSLMVKFRERVLNMNKKFKIISAPNVQTGDFSTLLAQMQNNVFTVGGMPVICVNYEVNIEEVDFDVRVQFEDDSEESVTKRILIGLGAPEAMVSADTTYGGSFLQMEALETEFEVIRSNIKKAIESELFKPISFMKGFITADLWGNVVVLYPAVDFRAGTIINKADFKDTLIGMVQDKTLPKAYLLEYFGFDPEEVDRVLKKEALEDSSFMENAETNIE